jgi:GTP cyclohydrolase IA
MSRILEASMSDRCDLDTLKSSVHATLTAIGEDPTREGLVKTPLRVAKAMAFLTSGYDQDAASILASAMFNQPYREMVLVRDIEVFSMCEHHMLPFHGKAHVAYIPSGRIVGLSKLARVVDAFARRLQVQERLTVQIRDVIDDVLEPEGTAVIIDCVHMCMAMRGVQKQHSSTVTSAMSGVFLERADTRSELMTLVRGN